MKRLVLALLLGTLCAGCAGLDRFRTGPSEAEQLVTRADELVRDGRAKEARDLYARVAAEPTRDPLHARALYDLGRLQVDPASGLRDYRGAHVTFKRLLAEYPGGEWESDARAWMTVLTELTARQAELAARAAELATRTAELTTRTAELAAREAEVARLRNEAAKVGADLQRLKRIDLNLERRR